MNIQTHFQLEKYIVSKYKLKIRAKMRAQNRFEQSFKKGALVTPSPLLLPPYHQRLQEANSHQSILSQSSPQKRNICHLCLCPTDIPPPLCRRSAKQEQPPRKSPWQNSNTPPFYPTFREYRSLFAAA